MSQKMLSILCITYNHEKYIAHSIDSMLMQKTNFDLEIVIGEDRSTDRTREICIEYQTKHPDKIRLLLNEKNIGGIANFIQTLKACQGKYIALLEGDDHWTTPFKLQKQIDFLESNPEYVICHHRYNIYKNNKKTSLSSLIKETISIEDLAAGNKIQTLTCIFRNLLNEIPAWLHRSPIGDYPLYMLLAQYGKIKFLNDPMAAYNIHQGGVWSNSSLIEQLKTEITTKELMYKYGNFSENVRNILLDSMFDNNLRLIRELVRAEQSDDIPHILDKIEHNYSKSDLVEKLCRCQHEIIAVEKSIKSTYSFRIGKFFTKNLRKLGLTRKFHQKSQFGKRL